jgi:sugar-specific transcriptional regulator TrmB
MVAMFGLLRSVGLNKYEAEAYLTLLKIGPSTAFNISKHGSVPYGRVYDSLNDLVSKGFVELVPSKPKRYRAVNPMVAINGFLDVKCGKLEELRGQVTGFVKDLKTWSASSDIVSVNKGKKNFVKAVVEHFNCEKEFWATSEEFKLEGRYPALRRYIKGDPSKRFVLVDVNKTSKDRIKELKYYGVNVKHYALEGVRLLVSDEELVTISIQKDEKDWTNINIKSKPLGAAFTKIIKTLWDKAKKIS